MTTQHEQRNPQASGDSQNVHGASVGREAMSGRPVSKPSEVGNGAHASATGDPVSNKMTCEGSELRDLVTPSAAGKRARIVSPNAVSNNTKDTHSRRRTASSSGGISTAWLPHASISYQSVLSNVTPTASLGPRLLNTNPPTLDATAYTPPRLVTHTTQEPASPQSVAAALERFLLVADKPGAATTMHSPVHSSPNGALRSPTTVKPRSFLSQGFLPGAKNAPTPCSSPCQPQPQSSPTLAAASIGVRKGQSGTPSIAPLTEPRRSGAAIFCLTTPALAASPVAGLGSKLQQAHAKGLRSDVSEGLVCPVGTPHCGVDANLATLECSATPSTTTEAARELDAMPMDSEAVCTTSMGRMHDVSSIKNNDRRRSVSVPASARQIQGGIRADATISAPTAPEDREKDAFDGCKSPVSGILHSYHHKVDDIAHNTVDKSYDFLKSESVNSGEVRPGVKASKDAPKLPRADNSEVMDHLKVSATHSNLRSSRSFSPVTDARVTSVSPAILSLTTDSVRVWNMLESSNFRDRGRTLSGMKSAGSFQRSESTSPVRRQSCLSPHLNPISNPSEWDAEDPLSIFKPQNLVFMPSGPAQVSCKVSRLEQPARNAMESNFGADRSALETVISAGAPEDDLDDSRALSDTWHPWQELGPANTHPQTEPTAVCMQRNVHGGQGNHVGRHNSAQVHPDSEMLTRTRSRIRLSPCSEAFQAER